jgi:hypothetical protein
MKAEMVRRNVGDDENRRRRRSARLSQQRMASNASRRARPSWRPATPGQTAVSAWRAARLCCHPGKRTPVPPALLKAALTALVNYHHALPFSDVWGRGILSSSIGRALNSGFFRDVDETFPGSWPAPAPRPRMAASVVHYPAHPLRSLSMRSPAPVPGDEHERRLCPCKHARTEAGHAVRCPHPLRTPFYLSLSCAESCPAHSRKVQRGCPTGLE